MVEAVVAQTKIATYSASYIVKEMNQPGIRFIDFISFERERGPGR